MKSTFSKWGRISAIAMIASLCAFSATAQMVVSGSDDHYQSTSLESNTIAAFETVAGSNRKLVVVGTWEGNSLGITNISYGSQTFTEAYSVNNAHEMVSIWYLDEPAVGTQDVVASWNGADTTRIGVLSLQNAVLGAPSLTDSVTGSLSIDVTTTVSNMFVIGAYTENNGGIAVSSTSFSNTLYSGASGSCESDIGYHSEAIAGLKSYSWIADTNTCVIGVVGFAYEPPPTPQTIAVENTGNHYEGNVLASNLLSGFTVADGRHQFTVAA
ncbi:MAG: hypothetical protein U9P12_01935, partial [Verrucomicrobiota bacterium]|nr:hypothetical protein [Verrucomicrobiota bacterium]